MAASNTINYKPPPILREFIKDYLPGKLFYDWIVGPVGSGKTTGIFFKLVRMASLQAKSPDGIRRTRAVVVRNTFPQLRDTTLSSWNYWFKDGQAGEWVAGSNKFILRFGDVECEVLFRALDNPGDVARVLSLEVTFAILDEFVQIPREIVDALSARCGRYPAKNDGGATNWGMWGSSNPDTEDNWWFENLHGNPEMLTYRPGQQQFDPQVNARYFVQPSGLADDAENIENLPGGRDYYTSQMKNKPLAWIKQFVEAEWGYSVSGKAVVQTFNAGLHVSKKPLIYDPRLPIVAGMDPGLGGSALIFGQQHLNGRVAVLGELVQTGFGAKRLIQERLKPYVRRRFPDSELIVAPDPAAASRSARDEKTIVDEFRKHYTVSIETNNRLPLRLDAIDHFCSTLIEGGPALAIDGNECPILVRALKGGWKYELNSKTGENKTAEPAKNAYSHPGDAYGYLMRYFHKLTEREMRYGNSSAGRFVPPRSFGSSYHHR